MANPKPSQTEGLLGRGVDWMIRRTVRSRFRNVYWVPPRTPLTEPVIFVPNHHGWHDGYLMYVLATKIQIPIVDWIQEYGAFPLFGKVGGMPYPKDDANARAATVKRTIRMMQASNRSLLLFAEAELHRPPQLRRFGRSLEVISAKVPQAKIIPVGIRYDMSLHERPEAFIMLGEPTPPGPDLAARTRLQVSALLDRISVAIEHQTEIFEVMAAGTPDVNERWGMNRPRK